MDSHQGARTRQEAGGQTICAVIFFLYFLSGFAALLYQIAWTRLTFSHFGIITANFSAVVAAFMLGLGIGSAAGDRIARQNLFFLSDWLRVALCETAIAVTAIFVPFFFQIGQHLLLSGGAFDSEIYFLRTGLIVLVALLPSCCLMGMTLPLLMKAVREQTREKFSSFGFLYLANTAGAVAGALSCAFVLIELFGIHNTLRFGNFANALAATLAVALAWWNEAKAIPSVPDCPATVEARPSSVGLNRTQVMLLIASTGFLVLGLETVWYRSFTAVLQSSVYAHGAILAAYLTATLIGTALYRRSTRRGNFFPATAAGLILVGVVLQQCVIGSLLAPSTIRLLISVATICLPMGYLFPGLIDVVAQSQPGPTGRAYALNVAAGVAGIFLTTYILIPWTGCLWSACWLSLPLLGSFFVCGCTPKRRWLPLLSCFVFLGALTAIPMISRGSLDEWPANENTTQMIRLSLHRDVAATALAYATPDDKRLAVNGIIMTNKSSLTKLMAHLPLLYVSHPPSNALVICFGMGTTFRSAMSWNIRTVAVDLSKSVIESFPSFFSDAQRLLDSGRAEIVNDDGRRFLKRTHEQFDVITIDPPPPLYASGSGLLYSVEFYTAAKRRLKPGGVLQQWIPSTDPSTRQAVARSLAASFPYVKAFPAFEGGGVHFLASEQPLVLPPQETWSARVPVNAQADLVEWRPGVNFSDFLAQALSEEKPIASLLGTDGPTITDDQPYNEFFALRKWNVLKREKF
jgi:spermidine synthase